MTIEGIIYIIACSITGIICGFCIRKELSFTGYSIFFTFFAPGVWICGSILILVWIANQIDEKIRRL